MKFIISKRFLITIITFSLLVAITGCSNEGDKTNTNNTIDQSLAQDNNENNQTTNNEEQQLEKDWPLTISVEGKELTITEKPQRIAALSLNVADVVMDLAGPDVLVTVTNSMEQEKLSHFSEEAKVIENKITGATSLDPEEVISYDPDLILLTLTHGAEEDADEILAKSGIPLASFSRWTTIKDLMNNYRDIGELIGEEERAQKIIESMEEKIDKAQQLIEERHENPTVLMLSQVGSNTGPYILGPSSIAYDLIQLAGGSSGSDALGLEKTSPASIEHIIEMDPEYIILVEWSATSDEFSELIESPGFKALSAVEKGNIKQINAKDISQANRFIIDQLEELAIWLNGNEE